MCYRKLFGVFAVAAVALTAIDCRGAVAPIVRVPQGNELSRAWLDEHGAQISSLSAIQVSRQLLADDPAMALQWYVIALARVYYDGGRCADATVLTGVPLILGMFTRDVVDYARSHPTEYLAAIRAVAGRTDHDLFGEPYPPLLCGNGLPDMMKNLGLPQQQIDVMSKLQQIPAKPESEWPAAAVQVRGLVADLERKVAEEVAHPPAVVAGTPVPEAVLKGTPKERVTAIGAEALRVIGLSDAKTGKYLRLQTLARAQIDAGDRAGALRSLNAAESLSEAADATNSFSKLNSIALFVAAGDKSSAAPIVAAQPPTLLRVQAWSRYGSALVQEGDLAAARQTLDQIDSAYAAMQTTSSPRPITLSGDPHGDALLAVGKAFAMALDFPDANVAAKRLAAGGLQVSLLAIIAGQQCKSGDLSVGHETLKTARQNAEAMDHNAFQWIAATVDVISASTMCDDVPTAVAIARQGPPKRSLELLMRTAIALTSAGDFSHALAIDRDNAENAAVATDLIDIARRQLKGGETQDAQSTIAKATRAVMEDIGNGQRPRMDQELIQIIDVDIQVGAYEDAITVSASFDEINRPQFLERVLATEVEKRDDTALKRSLPEVISVVSRSITSESYLTTLATTLARGGYGDDARMVLRQIETSQRAAVAGSLLARGRGEGIAGIELALGDRVAATATLTAAGVPASNVLQVIATDLMLDGQLDEALQTTMQLDDQHRNAILPTLVRKQIAAGDLTGAMTATWQITDPQFRGDALVELLKSLHT